ncbi:MAG: glycoside hydrolase [Lacrimispora sp.]|uniref:glycoside hydrolase n=1 Tax=Lacrimispora sp. TaxID=2719234 RepID=UPI0039E2B8B8
MKKEDPGFIALSYFGVDRDGTSSLISTKRLEEHMKALESNGYVTISQEDIKEYYSKGTSLPDNALFLMFEDGRRDTAIFSSNIMERYNYLGTVLSYGQKFDEKDSAFLSPKDLKSLEKTGFWEFGTNGYRLSYINVFDRYDNYLGELSLGEFNYMRKYLGRNYNQYLMDYIRDEDGIPKESHSQMEERISSDYELMEHGYTEKLGKLPGLYVLMHANTGRFGNHEMVSKVNEEWIKKLFDMNFNREGNSKNDLQTDIYDLTRMQPQAYWYPNHLLMRMKADTGKDMVFENGDKMRMAHWESFSGAAEFRDNAIALTSESKGNGLLKLKESEQYKDIDVSLHVTGNVLGIQRLYLRTGSDLSDSVMVELKNNILSVYDQGSSVYELDLADLDGLVYKTANEDNLESLKAAEYLYDKNEGLSYNIEQVRDEITQKEGSSPEGEEYVPDFQIGERGDRQLHISLTGDKLSIAVDGKSAVSDLAVTKSGEGAVYLESAFEAFGYSQRNIADDVYDGVFEDIVIRDGNGNPLYDNSLKGYQKLLRETGEVWNRVINWFIRTL